MGCHCLYIHIYTHTHIYKSLCISTAYISSLSSTNYPSTYQFICLPKSCQSIIYLFTYCLLTYRLHLSIHPSICLSSLPTYLLIYRFVYLCIISIDLSIISIRLSTYLFVYLVSLPGFRGGSKVKESACSVGDLGSIPGSGRSRKRQPAPVFLPGESHGQRSLMGYSPRGCKESDTTE